MVHWMTNFFIFFTMSSSFFLRLILLINSKITIGLKDLLTPPLFFSFNTSHFSQAGNTSLLRPFVVLSKQPGIIKVKVWKIYGFTKMITISITFQIFWQIKCLTQIQKLSTIKFWDQTSCNSRSFSMLLYKYTLRKRDWSLD